MGMQNFLNRDILNILYIHEYLDTLLCVTLLLDYIAQRRSWQMNLH